MDTDIRFLIFQGAKDYREILDLQEKTREEVIAKKHNGTIFFLEHKDVYTTGIRGKENDFIHPDLINKENIPVVKIRRGGEVTWHGPGQLIVYPVINFRKAGFKSIKEFVNYFGLSIESVLRKNYGISSAKWDEDKPGVWVDDRKIAFVGLHFRKFVPTHGFSLNLNPDLEKFLNIVPCGMAECKITSIFKETGKTPSVDQISRNILELLRKRIPELCSHSKEAL
jgi:lipoyl(octanoyl) transferase